MNSAENNRILKSSSFSFQSSLNFFKNRAYSQLLEQLAKNDFRQILFWVNLAILKTDSNWQKKKHP
jgi:hypothetical protein